MIGVIDYHMGNSGSIMNILRKVGGKALLSSDPKELATMDALILPGVGHFDKGMKQLHSLGLASMLNDRVVGQRTPILGICLGMQLFANGSEEGTESGLGWIDADFVRFKFDADCADLKIPHMGWNTIRLKKPEPLFDSMAADARFYFVHSFYARCLRNDDILATTGYGIEYVSAYASDAIVGVQFHPEKSLRWGIEVFRKFVQHVQQPSPASAPPRDPVPAPA
jgi:glutamine amidotransferase